MGNGSHNIVECIRYICTQEPLIFPIFASFCAFVFSIVELN
jgi:hypothetical protein